MNGLIEYIQSEYQICKPRLIKKLAQEVSQNFGPQRLSESQRRLFNETVYWATIYRVLMTLNGQDDLDQDIMIEAETIVPEIQIAIRLDLILELTQWKISYLDTFPETNSKEADQAVQEIIKNLELAVIFELMTQPHKPSSA